MYHQIKGNKSASAIRIELERGERLYAAPRALVACGPSHTGELVVEPCSGNSFLRGIANRFSGQKSLFSYDMIYHKSAAVWLLLCSPNEHQQRIVALQRYADTVLLLRRDSFLAAQDTLEITGTLPRDAVPAMTLTALHESGSAPLAIGGHGTVFLASAGTLEPVLLQEGQEVRFDAAHLVAWDAGITLAPPSAGIFRKNSAPLWGEKRRLLVAKGHGQLWLRAGGYHAEITSG